MKLAITGTPGCGKTTLAKNLAKKFSINVINEKDFALKNNIGSFNEENELEIPLPEFKQKLNSFLKKEKNIIIEGHLLCEMKLNVDKIILIKIDPEELELRLEQRHYSTQKIMDNVFCEGIEYCKKKVNKNYKKSQVIEISSSSSSKATLQTAIYSLKS